MQSRTTDVEETTRSARGRLFLVGTLCAFVGLLPWLLQGSKLPLQNLWAEQTMPDDMPFALLPFSQYYVVFLSSLLLIPWLLVGILSRATSITSRPRSVRWLGFGVALWQVVALTQTAVTVGRGLGFSGARAPYALGYLLLLTLGCAAVIAAGVIIFLLVAKAPSTAAVLGLAVGALFLGSWCDEFLMGDVIWAPGTPVWMHAVGGWVTTVFLGASLGWNGVWPLRSLISSLAAIVVFWLGAAVLGGLQYALGSRNALPYATELARLFFSGFATALTGLRVEAMLPVLVTGALVLVSRWLLSRAREHHVG